MWDLINIVIPKIKASWVNLAYCMGFDIDDVRGVEADSKDSGDRCRKLFENWLAGPGAHTPKMHSYHTSDQINHCPNTPVVNTVRFIASCPAEM